MGLPIEPARAKPGVGWLRLLTDIPTAASDLTHGYLTWGEYFRSLRATGIESVFSWSDPLPSLIDTAMVPWAVLKKYPQLFKRKS
jgi:predicted ATP-grasp superfamily ATP-dependent carboligase